MSGSRFVSRVAVVVGAVMAVWCAQASAGLTHQFVSSFGSFTNVQGVAVDQSTGDVYVLDTGANGGSLLKFDAAGKPLKFSGLTGEPFAITSLKGAESTENEVAVDNSSGPAKGDVYVAVGGSNGKEIDIFSSGGASLGTLGEASAPWGDTCGVTVDPSGNVYVGVAGSIDKFSPKANPVTNTDYVSSIGGRNNACDLAADSAGNMFVVETTFIAAVRRYEASLFGTSEEGTFLGGGSSVAVDPANDHLYIDKKSEVAEFGPHGEPFEAPVSTLAGGLISGSVGVAVNATSSDVYVSSGKGQIDVFGPAIVVPTVATGPASGVTMHGAVLSGSVNPEGVAVTSCEFEYGTSLSYGHSAPCSTDPGNGNAPVSETATVSGLASGGVYHFRLAASNANGEGTGTDETVTTTASIVTGSASGVTPSEATLSGSVNPEGEALTSCVFEYGATESYGHSTPCATTPGIGNSAVPVSGTLTELQFSSLYHYRLVTGSAAGGGVGADQTFTTATPQDSTGALGLPDERAYELVSPLENDDAEVYQPGDIASFSNIETQAPFQAAEDGNGFSYVGSPSVGGNESAGLWGGNQYLATRSSGGGWTQANISPPGSPSSVYQGFSSDLSVGFLDSLDALSPAVAGFGQELGYAKNYDILYATNTKAATQEYDPFFTTTPPNRSKGEFQTFHVHQPLYDGQSGREGTELSYAGASADSSHLLFQANDALTPDAEGGSERRFAEENNLYESVNGQLRLVNILPDGNTKADASFGAPDFEKEEGSFNYTSPDFSHVISNDGSRIFWTDVNTGHIYMREDGTKTVEISPAGQYWTATADGSKVYYTNGDLFEYDVESGHTTDLTPGVTVQGVVGASENGEYIYYVTTTLDLDVWHNGAISTIRTMTVKDNHQYGDWRPGFGNRTAEVTPNGRGMVFMDISEESNNFARVDVYDADNGHVYCASCGPSGSEGFVPLTYSNTYLRRWISEGGNRVFFDSDEGLVPQDTNGKLDAYEWERPGYGTCQSNSTGCVYLLSGGTSVDGSFFADASSSGDDAFIVTRAKLLAEDVNENYDLYDARVDGFTALTPPACTGTGCQGLPGAAPIFATPSSVTFEGVGNFAAPTPVKAKQKPKKRKKTKVAKRKAKHGKAHKKAKARKGRTSREGARS
jgi:hypothetical protein